MGRRRSGSPHEYGPWPQSRPGPNGIRARRRNAQDSGHGHGSSSNRGEYRAHTTLGVSARRLNWTPEALSDLAELAAYAPAAALRAVEAIDAMATRGFNYGLRLAGT